MARWMDGTDDVVLTSQPRHHNILFCPTSCETSGRRYYDGISRMDNIEEIFVEDTSLNFTRPPPSAAAGCRCRRHESVMNTSSLGLAAFSFSFYLFSQASSMHSLHDVGVCNDVDIVRRTILWCLSPLYLPSTKAECRHDAASLHPASLPP